MAQHHLPFGLDLLTLGTICEQGESRDTDVLVAALLGEGGTHEVAVRAEFVMPLKVDDIIEITRPLPFGESTDFLSKDLLERVAQSLNAALGLVRIGMMNRTQRRRAVIKRPRRTQTTDFDLGSRGLAQALKGPWFPTESTSRHAQ